MNNKVFVALAVLVLVALACTLTPVVATPTPAVTPTAQPPAVGAVSPQPPIGGDVPTQTPIAVGGNGLPVLFQDDFSNTNSGWDRGSNDSYLTDYATGGYRVNIIAANYSAFANPYQTFQNDVRIEVDATKIGGPDDNAFGVQCRYQDVDNYYFFFISSDGYVGIGVNKAGTKSIISSSDGSLIPDSSIIQGASTNHLRVDCIGSTLTLYVNGTQASTATDSSFTGGDVGFIARTYAAGGTDILYSNLFVYQP